MAADTATAANIATAVSTPAPAAAARRGPRARRQQGVALIEVLVSMMVIALWLLASAGMQAGMLKLQASSESRLKAIALATELGERMEVNSTEAKAGSYAMAAGTTVTPPNDCTAVACTTADLAKYDLRQWADRAAATLVLNSISVTRDTTAAVTTYVIVISWTEPRGRQTYGTAGTTETASYTLTKVVA